MKLKLEAEDGAVLTRHGVVEGKEFVKEAEIQSLAEMRTWEEWDEEESRWWRRDEEKVLAEFRQMAPVFALVRESEKQFSITPK